MTNFDPNARPPDLRGAWRWGLWIGSGVLLIGVLGIAGGLYFSYPGSADAPTPRMTREDLRSATWLFVQGAYAAVIGGAILALSLVNLYCQRQPPEERGRWDGPVQ